MQADLDSGDGSNAVTTSRGAAKWPQGRGCGVVGSFTRKTGWKSANFEQ
jgi:hypothetical protein